MINIFYRYHAPQCAEPKLHAKTVPLSEARPIVEALHPVASEILAEHVPMSKLLHELQSGARPAPTPNAVRIK
jgi:hypothetical protein